MAMLHNRYFSWALCLLALVLGPACYGQSVVDYPVLPANVERQWTAESASLPTLPHKTGEEICVYDSAYVDSFYLYRLAILCGNGPELITLDDAGYATGTSHQKAAMGIPYLDFTHFALFFKYDVDPSIRVLISEVYFPYLTETTMAVVTKVVNEPDTFRVQIYEGSRMLGPKVNEQQTAYLPPLDESKFTVNTIEESMGLIMLPNCLVARDSFFLAFEVQTKTSDDTLAFYATQLTLQCGEGEKRTWHRMVDSLTYEGEDWDPLSDKMLQLEGQQYAYDSDILMIPVVLFDLPVSNDRPAIREKALGLWGFFPNPAHQAGKLRIELASPLDVDVHLYDMHGRNVRDYRFGRLGSGNHDLDMDLSGLAPGVYVYDVQTENGRLASKLVVN